MAHPTTAAHRETMLETSTGGAMVAAVNTVRAGFGVRTLFGASAFVVALLVATLAQGAPLQCETSVPMVPMVAPTGPSAVSDIDVTCTGDPVGPGTFDVQVFYNTDVVDPTAGVLTSGGLDYAGTKPGAQTNAVLFSGVPLSSNLEFTVGGVLTQPTAQMGGVYPVGMPIVAFLSTVPFGAVPIINPQQTVATVGPATIPEPALLLLVGMGLGLMAMKRHAVDIQ